MDKSSRPWDTDEWIDGVTTPYNVDVANRLGSIHAALVLHRLLMAGRLHADEDGWFSMTSKEMERLTSVGERGYADARRTLQSLGLIESRRAGLPARTWIRLNCDALDSWFRDVLSSPMPPKYKKDRIPNDLRWQVFLRDDFRCKHCGVRDNLAVDHIIPESRGGTLDFDNLQTLCKPCNSRKGAR